MRGTPAPTSSCVEHTECATANRAPIEARDELRGRLGAYRRWRTGSACSRTPTLRNATRTPTTFCTPRPPTSSKPPSSFAGTKTRSGSARAPNRKGRGELPEPGCTGDIGPDGYCSVCGMKVSTLVDVSSATTVVPKQPSVDSGSRDHRAGTTRRPVAATGRNGSSPRNRLGGGFIDIPPIAEHDPATAVIEDLVIPENKRTCSVDGEPVGRSRDGVPGRTEGFCPKCGHAVLVQAEARSA